MHQSLVMLMLIMLMLMLMLMHFTSYLTQITSSSRCMLEDSGEDLLSSAGWWVLDTNTKTNVLHIKQVCLDLIWYLMRSSNVVQRSFCKQFYGSVTKSEYIALRHGFIMVLLHSLFSNMLFPVFYVTITICIIPSFFKTHCPTNPSFNFHKYMLRTVEMDFKKVVTIRYLALLDYTHQWLHKFFCLTPFLYDVMV